MTIGQAVAAARARLIEAGIAPAEAALDAELLARDVLHLDRASFVVRDHEVFPAGARHAYDTRVRRRAAREPVAYIRGVQEFWGRDFLVNGAVLIPRPETEFIIEEALDHLAGSAGIIAGLRIVDVGTGSGCLAITIAAERPEAAVYATDVSGRALEVARANARRHGVQDRVTFLEAPYLAGVPAPVALIVTNPPYVAEADSHGLAPEVRDHEPATALFGGADGLRDIRTILDQAVTRLTPGGHLLMEVGFDQSRAVAAEVAARDGLELVRFRNDLQGIPRVGVIRRA